MPELPEEPKDAAEVEGRMIQLRNDSRESLDQSLGHHRNYLLSIANHKLNGFLRRLVSPSDVVHDTFVLAIRDYVQFQGGESSLKAWLRGILCHRLKYLQDWYRAEKRNPEKEVPLDGRDVPGSPPIADLPGRGSSPSSALRNAELSQAVERALGQLPHDYRRVVVAHYREGRSFEEIGRELGRSAEAARKLWARAILQLGPLLRDPADSGSPP